MEQTDFAASGSTPGGPATVVSSLEIVYERRKGLRRLRMAFDYSNRLVVAVPWNCRAEEARKFVAANRDWIAIQAARLAPVRTLSGYLSEHPFLSVGDEGVRVEIRRVSAGRSLWILDERRREGLLQVGPRGGFEEGLVALVRKVASEALSARTLELAAEHGLNPARTVVRDQRSRWGSCSRTGTISLNWRLLLLPTTVRDSVILHELAHLRHLDHSPRFHAYLNRIDPRRAGSEKELDRRGPALMRVGRR